MTKRTLTALEETAAGVPANGSIVFTPVGVRSSDPTLVTPEPIVVIMRNGVLADVTGDDDTPTPPTIWSPGNYRIQPYDSNGTPLEPFTAAVEESDSPISINELYRQSAGADPVVDDQPLYTGDDASRLVLEGAPGQVAAIGLDGHLVAGDAGTGSGDMQQSMYDPTNVHADAFNRGNHYGHQTISTITGLSAALDGITFPDATEDASGLMPAADKAKLNGVAPGATANASDATLENRANHTGTQAIGTVTGLQPALDAKADLVGGFVPTAQIPAIAMTDYLGTVASQINMLALVGQKGDWALRSDLGTTWIIIGADPTQLSNWQQLNYPAAPVTSVNGQAGTVVLGKSDVGLGSADNTSDAAKPVSTATQAALNGKVDKSTLTAKGDLFVATAGAAPARLSVGANNSVLTADNTQASGVRWATSPAGGYRIATDLILHEVVAGTANGPSLSTVWTVRPVNAIQGDGGTAVSIGSGSNANRMLLPAGTYPAIEARGLHSYNGRFRMRFRSVNPANAAQADPDNPQEWYDMGAAFGDSMIAALIIVPRMTLSADTWFVIESIVQTPDTGGYTGIAGATKLDGSLVPEIYTTIRIARELVL